MDHISNIQSSIGESWIPLIYVERIRPMRTRSLEMDIPERENDPLVLETLLGWELKVGKRRISCPTIDTARYLQVFARLGCRNIAVPYDITEIGPLNELLRDSWIRCEAAITNASRSLSPQMAGKIRSGLIRKMREEIAKAGAGELMPLFNKPTKQRPNV